MSRNALRISTTLVAVGIFMSVLPAYAQTGRADAALSAAALTRLDSMFAPWSGAGSPGVSVAVIRDGRILVERGYGSAQLEHGVPITPATIFHVASVTKQFTAFGVALLDARGALSLDDDVRTHIPELPDLGHGITLRQLVHHTSGIRDQWELLVMAGWRLDDVITKDHVLGLMSRQRELNFEPGSEHLYSNMGYTLLAEVVERVGGRPFPEWMRAEVFEPLGMASTHMHDDHERVVPGRAYSYRGSADGGWRNAVLSYANAGATSLFTTAGDLARWLRNYETAEVGGPDVIARMRERGVLSSGDTLAYAFAIVRGEHAGRVTWSHGGADAGFRSMALHFPAERLGVVVLSNVASFTPGPLAAAVADLFLGPAPAGRPTELGALEPTVSVPGRVLDAYAGRWEIDGVGVVRFRRQAGGLVLDVPDGGVAPLRATSDSTFGVGSSVIRFVRGGESVDRLVASNQGVTAAGRRLGSPVKGAALATYAGDYYSPELEAVYRVTARGDGLVARHVRHGEIPLESVSPDLFSSARWYFRRVEFTRDAAGAVDGFRVTAGRVRNVRFIKLQEGVLAP